jgi:hypothetical protein
MRPLSICSGVTWWSASPSAVDTVKKDAELVTTIQYECMSRREMLILNYYDHFGDNKFN